MAEKMINTRIQLKYDSFANWTDKNPLLKSGEVAIAYIAESHTSTTPDNSTHPVMFKVGPGNFNSLPWTSALAADVHAWAKKSEDDFKTWVKGLVSVEDIDLSAYYNKTEVDGLLSTNSTNDQKYTDDAIAALKLSETYAAKVHSHEIDDVNGLSDAIADAKKAGTDTNAALEAYKGTNDVAVGANTDAIAAMKAGATVVTFKGLEEEIAKKQDIIPENTYDAHGSAAQALIDAKAYADGKVASVTAGDASVSVGGTATAPTVAAKLSADADNALTLAEDGLKVVIPAAAEYSIVKAENSGDYAAVYNLTKDGTIVGASINIPKDMVVKSGSVVGDEIILILNDKNSTEIKIPVASLIEYVTSGSNTGDMVVVNVSDDHKVTATITDGTITLTKLTTEVQTAIGKAHTHENLTVLDGINADKVAAWDTAEQNAKDYADGLNAAMDSRVTTAIEDAKTDASNKDAVVLAEAQKGIAAVQTAVDTHTDNTDIHVTAEQKTTWSAAVQTITAAADSGLKATKTDTDVVIEIDDSIVWVFNCGDSNVTAE